MQPKYKRILLKLSGEALMGDNSFGLDPDVLTQYATDIKGDQGIRSGSGHCDRGW